MRHLLLALVVALGAAACGDDGDGRDEPGNATAEAEDGSGDAALYCALGQQIYVVNQQLGASGEALEALGDAATPEEVAAFRSQGRELLSEFSRLLDEAAAVAPPDIRDAAVVLADAFAVVDEDEVPAGVPANPLDVPEVQEANDRVADWAVENCSARRA